MLIITADQARYYDEACTALKNSQVLQLDAYPGLTRGDACDWAIIGFTVQDWLSFKEILLTQKGIYRQLLNDRAFYENQLRDRYKFLSESQKKGQ